MNNWAYFLMKYFSKIETSKALRYFDDVQQKKTLLSKTIQKLQKVFFKHYVSLIFFYSKTKYLKTNIFFFDYSKLTSLYDNEVVNDSKSVTI